MTNLLPACISCNKQIRDAIYNGAFYPNLLIILSAFIVLAVILAILTYLNLNAQRRRKQHPDGSASRSRVPLNTAGMVLGIGLGGFVDGIVLHQLLQWHEMLSAKIPATNYVGKSVNMFWDGVFHAFCFLVVLLGLMLLWRAATSSIALKSGRLLIGGMLSGWAMFNLVEGTIDHHLLKLHNVMEYAPDHDIANFTFLGGSVLMLLFGTWLSRTSKDLSVLN
ncbi:MAG: DUF2243 domain-containing protein [Pedobacter sp.]